MFGFGSTIIYLLLVSSWQDWLFSKSKNLDFFFGKVEREDTRGLEAGSPSGSPATLFEAKMLNKFFFEEKFLSSKTPL